MTKPKKSRKTFNMRQEEINLLYDVLYKLNTLILMDLYKPMSRGEVDGLYFMLRECRNQIRKIGNRSDPDGLAFVEKRQLYGGEP